MDLEIEKMHMTARTVFSICYCSGDHISPFHDPIFSVLEKMMSGRCIIRSLHTYSEAQAHKSPWLRF